MTAEPIDYPRGYEPPDAQNPLAPGAQDTAAAMFDSAPNDHPPLRVVPPTGQRLHDSQGTPVGVLPPEGHIRSDAQSPIAPEGQDTDRVIYEAHAWREGAWWVVDVPGVGATQAETLDGVARAARALVADMLGNPSESVEVSIESVKVSAINKSPDRAKCPSMPILPEPGRGTTPAAGASVRSVPMEPTPRLLDPTLAMAADVLTDLEAVRIGNENRLRQMTRSVEDKDGELRGFGLDKDHPDVAALTAIVDGIAKLEHQATLNLQRAMRRHPLGPWVKAQKGIGEKQAARLIASIGDPYWNTLYDRPRTVSELWAFCGLHTLPVGQFTSDTHGAIADGAKSGSSDLGHVPPGVHEDSAWVAARRQRGQKSNWSTAAKMRAWNVATSCIKQAESPYRAVYDARRAATEGRLHAAPCVRCGPSGKPAAEGTPWSKGHQHADALRIVSKAILKDLWRAAREVHAGCP